MSFREFDLWLNKPWAFVRKDFISASSYKLSFLMELAGIFFSVTVFFFMSKLFGAAFIPQLKPYGGDYFSFVIIGVAFSSYLGIALGSMSSTIMSGQVMGTLEAMLATQTEIPTLIISSSLYQFIWTSLRVVAHLVIGWLGFGLNFHGGNFLGAILLLIMTMAAFSSVGIITASFVMVFKRGDPVSWVFTSFSGLLGGMYYPVSVLPVWMQKIAYFFPLTNALEGARLALLKGYTLGQLAPYFMSLTVFTAVVMPVSILGFKYAVKRAKMDGTLTQF